MPHKRTSSLPTRKTRRASVQSKVSVPRRTRSVFYKSRRSRKSPEPSKFSRIIVGNSPEEHSPNIFKEPGPEGFLNRIRRKPPKEKNHTNVDVPNHIKAEDIETYQQTAFISYLSREMIKKHLNEYIENNPKSTYEEWIKNLHSVNAKKGKYGHIILDPRFYLPKAESLRYWKNVQKRLHSDNWAKI